VAGNFAAEACHVLCLTPAAAAEPGEKRLHSVRSTSDVVLNVGGSCGKVVEMRRRRGDRVVRALGWGTRGHKRVHGAGICGPTDAASSPDQGKKQHP
jgi:hypothetical protein